MSVRGSLRVPVIIVYYTILQYYADGEDAYAMKKDLGALLQQVEQDRTELKSLGRKYLKASTEKTSSSPSRSVKAAENGCSDDFEEELKKLKLTDADPNIYDEIRTV